VLRIGKAKLYKVRGSDYTTPWDRQCVPVVRKTYDKVFLTKSR
jgi:hypothetical protein